MTIGLALEHIRVDKYIGELPLTFFPYVIVPMTLKMVGDHEALRYQWQDVMVKTWKYNSAIPLELLDVGPSWGSTGSFEDPLDAYQLERPP